MQKITLSVVYCKQKGSDKDDEKVKYSMSDSNGKKNSKLKKTYLQKMDLGTPVLEAEPHFPDNEEAPPLPLSKVWLLGVSLPKLYVQPSVIHSPSYGSGLSSLDSQGIIARWVSKAKQSISKFNGVYTLLSWETSAPNTGLHSTTATSMAWVLTGEGNNRHNNLHKNLKSMK